MMGDKDVFYLGPLCCSVCGKSVQRGAAGSTVEFVMSAMRQVLKEAGWTINEKTKAVYCEEHS